MRILNVFAALSGFAALAMLALAAHALRDSLDAAAIDRIELGAMVELISAAAGLAIANRSGPLNLVAGVLIIAGAAVFAGALYGASLFGAPPALAPVGGFALLAGWLTLAFARPGQ